MREEKVARELKERLCAVKGLVMKKMVSVLTEEMNHKAHKLKPLMPLKFAAWMAAWQKHVPTWKDSHRNPTGPFDAALSCLNVNVIEEVLMPRWKVHCS